MEASRPHSAHERLSALRQPASTSSTGSRWPIGGLLIGAVGIVGLALIAWNARADSAQVVTGTGPVTTEVVVRENSLLAGEALVAVAAERGTFPPRLAIGDTVKIVVVPRYTGEVDPDPVTDVGVVHDVAPPSDISSVFVITLRAAESVAQAVAGAEDVHLSIVMDAMS